MLLHGCPGTGKSAILHWMREFFEEQLGWEHGIYFMFTAPMNTMAGLIGGETLHKAGGVQWSANANHGAMEEGGSCGNGCLSTTGGCGNKNKNKGGSQGALHCSA